MQIRQNNGLMMNIYNRKLKLGFVLPLVILIVLLLWILQLSDHYYNVDDWRVIFASVKENTRLVFIDLGAGYGRTLQMFLYDSRKKRDFMIPDMINPNQFEIYLFEANPQFTKTLLQYEYHLQAQVPRINIKVFPETIVWTTNFTSKTFWIDTVHPHSYRSSIYRIHENIKAKNISAVLNTIDFVTWFQENFTEEDWVIINMDIEGSECDILPAILDKGASKLIDVMYLHYYKKYESISYSRRGFKNITQSLIGSNVILPIKNPITIA